MTARERVVFGFVLVALGALAAVKIHGALGGRLDAALDRSPLEPLRLSGDAPPFAATDASGRSVSLADLRGRPVVLNFWYSDCEPCRHEMPSLHALAERASGVQVVALSVDASWKKVHDFFASDPRLARPAFRTLLDPQRTVPPRYGTFKFPETFLIDARGRLVARVIGPRDWASADAVALVEALAR